jgi:hypothetical protein
MKKIFYEKITMEIFVDGPKLYRMVFTIGEDYNVCANFYKSSRKTVGIIDTICNIKKNIFSEIYNMEN